jgi:hypothetical protein
MTIPKERPAIVGVSRLRVWPWVGAGPYADADACEMEGLGMLEDTSTEKLAVVKGGQSVDPLEAFVEERQGRLKVSVQKADLRLREVLMAGSFAMDAEGGAGGNEVQYYAPNDGSPADWDAYFRMEAESETGDGTLTLRFFKCKLEGNLAGKLEREKITDVEFDCLLFADTEAARADGTTGGLSEYLWRGGDAVAVQGTNPAWVFAYRVLPGESLRLDVSGVIDFAVGASPTDWYGYPEGAYASGFFDGSAAPAGGFPLTSLYDPSAVFLGTWTGQPVNVCPDLPQFCCAAAFVDAGSGPPAADGSLTGAIRTTRSILLTPAEMGNGSVARDVYLIFNDQVTRFIDNAGQFVATLTRIA